MMLSNELEGGVPTEGDWNIPDAPGVMDLSNPEPEASTSSTQPTPLLLLMR